MSLIHQLFEKNVSKQPDRIALQYHEQYITYFQLNKKANQLAHYLINIGMQPNDLVAISLERSINLIVAILGVLKAGGAYVPIDVTRSSERINIILNQAKPLFSIVDDQTESLIRQETGSLINLERESYRIESTLQLNPQIDTEKADLAYVIFTSGTTGIPNGVSVGHDNIVNLIESTSKIFDFSANDVWTLFHSYAFDFSVWEIWGALAHGGTLVIVPFELSRSPYNFYELLIKHKVTILNQTPSAFNQIITIDEQLTGNLSSIRKIILGGEAIDLNVLATWFEKNGDQRPEVYNMYGITEVTVHASYHRLTKQDIQMGKNIIGKALPSYDLQLFDENGHQVAQGNKGEICVLGQGVTRGYLNNHELTQRKFIGGTEDKFNDRLYKSGDIGRYLNNGTLEYLGRMDNQVKIRGFRIELAEIESVLNQQPEIYSSVVLVKNKEIEKKQLIAFIRFRSKTATITPKQIQARIKNLLPEYMLPSRIISLPQMPLTINGKIDKEALLRDYFIIHKEHRMNKPLSVIIGEAELELTKLIEHKIDFSSNFYDAGGNSLSAISFLTWIKNNYGVNFTVKDLFEMTLLEILISIEDYSTESV